KEGAVGKYHYYPLAKGKTDRHMEPLYIVVQPCDDICTSSHEGEEFVIVLPDTPLEKAAIVAEKIRKGISRHKVAYDGKELSVTASFGVASLVDHAKHIEKSLGLTSLHDLYSVYDLDNADWDHIDAMKKKIEGILLKMADKALYEAKYTRCGACGYHTDKDEEFAAGKCPTCGSQELTHGRNRTVQFGSVPKNE
ncbi:MAG TPA: diguanylate cyclase, partial [Spirochaetota bacterium]|nr:diguanylate cyclase [Spirochaetota bacterium]